MHRFVRVAAGTGHANEPHNSADLQAVEASGKVVTRERGARVAGSGNDHRTREFGATTEEKTAGQALQASAA